MSAKYFCDLCGKEVEPIRLLPKKNAIKVKNKYVAILISLKVGVERWDAGELCAGCILEAVDSYLRGVGTHTHGPD